MSSSPLAHRPVFGDITARRTLSPCPKPLIAAHAPSANTAALADAALRGASNPDVGATRVEMKSPFDIKPEDLSDCDGFMIGTTENIGYMAGATKDMFDRCYNEWLDRREGLPVAIHIRAALDGTQHGAPSRASSARNAGASSRHH